MTIDQKQLAEAIKNMYGTFNWSGSLDDRARVLHAATVHLEHLETGGWFDIKDAPMDKYEIFLVSSKKYYPPYVVVNASTDCPLKEEYPWRTHQSGNKIHKSIITHYMLLPKPPTNTKPPV